MALTNVRYTQSLGSLRVDGVEVSRHSREREALEAAHGYLEADPTAEVVWVPAPVRIEADAVEEAEPAPEPEPESGLATLGENEPDGFTAVVGRNFDSVAEEGDGRGTGEFPWKTGGSEGWDDIESRYANLSRVDAPFDPVAGGGAATGSVLRVTYEGTSSGNAPATTQQQPWSTYGSPLPRTYHYHTLRLGPNYQVGGVTNKIWFHRQDRSQTFLALRNDGEHLRIGVNFQDTPDHSRGFIWGKGDAALLARETWYSIETLLERNSGAGVADGIFRCWVNGALVIDLADVEYKDGADFGEAGCIHVSPTCGSCDDLIQPFHFDLGVSYSSGAA